MSGGKQIKTITDLQPDPRNANRGTPRGHGIIEHSIRKHGAGRPGLAAKDGTMIAGSQTLEEMAALGFEIVPIHTTGRQWPVHIRDDIEPGSPEAIEMALEDNRSSELGLDWDASILADLPDSVDLSRLFRDEEMAALLEGVEEPPDIGGGGDEFDGAPAVDGPTRTALGDLWRISGNGLEHRLAVGDCTDPAVVERLMGGERASAVVTDPPYGQNQEGITNDEPEGLRELFDGCLAVLPVDNAVVIAFQSTRLFPMWLDAIRSFNHNFERALTYYDTGGWSTFPWRGWMPHSQIILVSSVGKPHWPKNPTYVRDVYSVNNQLHADSSFVSAHPTMKHFDTVQSLVEHATDGGIVYDPFLGSGTTLVAAHRLGVPCYGIEIDPRHASVCLARAEAAGLTCVRQ